jgi:PAS domain-containing protein
MNRPDQPDQPDQPKQPERRIPLRVLLVENTLPGSSVLHRVLTQTDAPEFELVHAKQLEEALCCLESQPVDVILLDLFLADEHERVGSERNERGGLELVKEVYQQAPDIPIVVLSMQEEEDLASRAIQVGAQDYLIREHLNGDALVHVLLCSVERHRMQRQLQHYSHEVQVGEARFRNLITRNADGIIVVDAEGVVRFVNPSAEALFGHTADALQGELFGFPVLLGESTEIDIVRRREDADTPIIAELRVVETEWEGKCAYLISLRDITARKRTEEALRETEQFVLAILNSIDAHIAVINEQGIIVAANDFWVQFAQEHGDPAIEHTRVGVNLFEACRHAFQESSRILDGMTSVLQGTTEAFEIDYPFYEASQEERWFRIQVYPLVRSAPRRIVVVHREVTEARRLAKAEAELEANTARIRGQEREIRGLLQLSSTSLGGDATTSMFGTISLHKSAPHVFDELLQRYETIMEQAVEQRAYKVDYSLSEDLRVIAERLGFLKASPRDVVEIHSQVLQTKSRRVNPLKAQAYTEEGRLMVLELMGYLASYYRSQSLGMTRTLLHKRQDEQQSVEQEK